MFCEVNGVSYHVRGFYFFFVCCYILGYMYVYMYMYIAVFCFLFSPPNSLWRSWGGATAFVLCMYEYEYECEYEVRLGFILYAFQTAFRPVLCCVVFVL